MKNKKTTKEIYVRLISMQDLHSLPELKGDILIWKLFSNAYIRAYCDSFDTCIDIISNDVAIGSLIHWHPDEEDIFDELYVRLGHDTFTKLFPVILTDNGSEFSNPSAIEFKDGIRRTHIFYCDPAASHQKGECENNHLFIRKISPKGKSMDHFTQATVDKMMSHINSYSRKSISDLSPIDLFITMYGSDILETLNIDKIHHDSINLSPSLVSESERAKNE